MDMNKRTLLALSMIFSMSLAACSNSATKDSSSQPQESTSDVSEKVETNPAGKMLIAYFTLGENQDQPETVDTTSSASLQMYDQKVTGNTGIVAYEIQKATGADMFSIHSENPYSKDYDEVVTIGKEEKDKGDRPVIQNHIENLDQYDTIFIGFPNWWYGLPAIMDTFFEEYDFSGKTIVPFATSGGSGFSDAIDKIKEYEPDATVLDGLHIRDYDAENSQNTVDTYLESINIKN